MFLSFCLEYIWFVHWPLSQYWLALYNSTVMKWPELGVVAFVCCIDKVGNGVALAPFLILS